MSKKITSPFLVFSFVLFFLCFFNVQFTFAGDLSKSPALVNSTLEKTQKSTNQINVDEYGFTEYIKNFRSDIVVNQDSTTHVTETIQYDFKENQKHGIYRTIPLTDVVGSFDTLQISNIKVTDENGNPYNFEESKNLGFLNGEGDVEVKIGDADKTISGLHTYVISYDLKNALGYFDDRTEIYWNVTGNDWQVPILNAEATVTLPGSIPESSLKLASYCGLVGSKDSCGLIKKEYNSNLNQTNIYFSTSNYTYLNEQEGLTIAAGFPKNLVAYPSKSDHIKRYIKKYWVLPLPLLITLLWFRKSFSYWLHRRKFYKNNTIIAEYDPGDMDPLESAGIIKGFVSKKNISAHIIYLAICGYIVINKNDGEYVFNRTNKDASVLTGYTKDLLNAISEKSETDLLYGFHKTASKIIGTVRGSLVVREYIQKSRYIVPGDGSGVVTSVMAIFLGIFLAVNPGAFVWVLVGEKAGMIFSLSCILIGFMYAIIKPRTGRLTDKGLEAERKLLGLKLYISVAESERIKFHNAPEKTPELFEKLLPYAMVFDLEEKWAKEFEDIYKVQPNWYIDQNTAVFSTVFLAQGLKDFSNSTAIFSSKNGSGSTFGTSGFSSGSSSGSSGGGGGGGGGGSW